MAHNFQLLTLYFTRTFVLMLELTMLTSLTHKANAQIVVGPGNVHSVNSTSISKISDVYPAECGIDFYGNDEMQPQCRRNVRSSDLVDFMALYTAFRPEADVNGDGTVNDQDLTLFTDSAGSGNGPVVRIQTNLGPTYSVLISTLDAYKDAYDDPNANPDTNELSSFNRAQPCYRFQNLAGTRFGKAYVFSKGALDIDSGIFKDPIAPSAFSLNTPDPVCLNNLGEYDSETGVRTATNDGYLQGLYHGVDVESDPCTPNTPCEWPDANDGHRPGNIHNVNNDFRVGNIHDYESIQRDDYNHASQVGVYYFYNDYRNRVLTPTLIKSLNLNSEIEKNLLYRQFRPDMPNDPDGNAPWLKRLVSIPVEVTYTNGITLNPFKNLFFTSFASWYTADYTGYKQWSTSYAPETSLADALGLVELWISGTNEVMPANGNTSWYGSSGDGVWKTNILSGLNDASFDWSAYRYLSLIKGEETSRAVTEHTREYFYGIRLLRGYDPNESDLMSGVYACGSASDSPTDPDCDKGENINNVMTMEEYSGDGSVNRNYFFPFYSAGYGQQWTQFLGSDLAGTFIAAIFYDIAHRAGLGSQRADMLFWKSVSLIDRTDNMPMRRYGQLIQEAARKLWPDSNDPTVSVYEEVIRHSLLMRGIGVDATFYCSDLPDIYGANDDYTCCPFDGSGDPACDHVAPLSGSNAARVRYQLPPGVGYDHPENFEIPSTVFFGGGLPENHPTATGYGLTTGVGRNRYTHHESADYIAYTFLKDSRYGPLDRFLLTNDTRPDTLQRMYDNQDFSCADPIGAGFKCYEFTGEELDNKTVFLPSNIATYARYLKRASNNREANYTEDTAPIGTRAIRAEVNGFSFDVTKLGENTANVQYMLSVNDPSYNPATDSYSWTITKYFGNNRTVNTTVLDPMSGLDAQLTLKKNQPVVIELTRTRNGVPSTLRIVDRTNDLDRSNGEQFTKSLL